MAAKHACLHFQRRIILGNPLLDDLKEFFGLRHNLLRLSLGGDKCIIVVDDVPFPPSYVEIIAVWVCGFTNREFYRFKRNPIVSSADDAIARTGNRHFGSLECGIVGSGETLSADAPPSDASARSRRMTARSVSSSLLDVLCR